MNSRLFGCLLCAGAVLGGCPAPQTASTVIGASGGSVSVGDGSSVSIPSGALPASKTITASQTPAAPTPSNTTVVGTPITFGPEGQQFATPVTVTLTFDASKLPAGTSPGSIVIATAPVGSTSFTNLQTTLVDSTHVSAQTTHFSVFEPTVRMLFSTDGGTSDGGESSGTDAGTTCESPNAVCSTGCTNTMGDPNNCGACGVECRSGVPCTNGVCATATDAGSGCSSSAQCPGGFVCEANVCVAVDGGVSCGSPNVMCSTGCTNVSGDPSNCGACGNACEASQACVEGACMSNASQTCTTTTDCAPGLTCGNGVCQAPDGGTACTAQTVMCSTGCTNLAGDPNNCGQCGTMCPSGVPCMDGACVNKSDAGMPPGCTSNSSCPAGFVCQANVCESADGGMSCGAPNVVCSTGCTNITGDPKNCGGCGVACAAGAACQDSVCTTPTTCPTGEAMCGPGCISVTNDPNNCGACGQVCPAGESCTAGQCVCGTGLAMCQTGCTDTTSDPGNCGSCGDECPGGMACQNSVCVTQGACATGLTECEAGCENLQGDPNNCGACGTACRSGVQCVAGACNG